MHCKKCLHYDVCVKLGKPSLYGINQEIGCSAYKDKTKWAEKKEPETNADRIRAMSDEELAMFLADEIGHGDCYDCTLECATFDGDKFNNSCHNAFYRWLKQPAD